MDSSEGVDSDGSIDSTLRRMLAVAAKAFDSHDAIRDVHFQLFGSSRAADVSGRRKARSSIGFDVFLCWHRSTGPFPEFGRPWLQFRAARFQLQTPCTIRSTSEAWRPLVGLCLGAHLKPKFVAALEQGVPLANQVGSGAPMLGKAFTALIARANTSVQGGRYAEANEVLTKIRNSLMKWLPKSPFAAGFDLNDLEVVLRKGNTGRRYVSNTMLDAGSYGPALHAAEKSTAAKTIRNGGDNNRGAHAAGLQRRLRVVFVEQEP